MKRITVSLPDDLVEKVRHAAGGEGQVSAYVAIALADYQERENLDEILAAWHRETPVPGEIQQRAASELDAVGLAGPPERQSDSGVSVPPTRGLTLDTGALLALDQPDKAVLMQARLDETRRRGGTVCIPVGVVAQAWRSPRQVRLARLLKSPDVDIAIMTLSEAHAIGSICAGSGHDDVIDVHVALCARAHHHAIVTSDPDDMARIDPTLPLIPT